MVYPARTTPFALSFRIEANSVSVNGTGWPTTNGFDSDFRRCWISNTLTSRGTGRASRTSN